MSDIVTALVKREQLDVAKRVDDIAAAANEVIAQGRNSFAAEIAIAHAIVQMRAALTPGVMEPILSLAGTALGFRMDKAYPPEVIRDCFIEAKLRGFSALGNEWNIISGTFYAAKNGLMRKVQTWPGLTDLKLSLGLPKVATNGATVPCSATWKVAGVADHLEAEIAVRLTGGQGADAAVGKAERKLLHRIHARLSGITTPEGEVEETAASPQLQAPAPAASKHHPEDRLPTHIKGEKPASEPEQTEAPDQQPLAREQQFADLVGKEAPIDRIVSQMGAAADITVLNAVAGEVDEAIQRGEITKADRQRAVDAYRSARERLAPQPAGKQ